MASGWKLTLHEIDMGLPKYKKAFDAYMTEKIRDAARSWLRTVLIIIPTWSKASRATFEDLADRVGSDVTYGPLRAPEDREGLGRSHGDGGLRVLPLKTYAFWYSTSLKHLMFNEFNRATIGRGGVIWGLINPTPYKFLDAGRADFRSYARGMKLPSPLQFLKMGKKI